MGNIKLMFGDCLKRMQEIENKSIDMILCDLPYGTTKNKWDSVIPLEQLWKEYNRIIKDNGAMVLFAQKPFDIILGYSNLKMFRYEWIWEKSSTTGFLNANKMPMKGHENILVFYKKLPTYNPQKTKGKPYVMTDNNNSRLSENYNNFNIKVGGNREYDGWRFPIDIIKFNVERGMHPTQKPVALCEYLIKTYTNENDIVLDNCMGSGTTGVACVNTSRRFIGIENNKEYYKMAKERIKKAHDNIRD